MCAYDQNYFWEYHNALLENQDRLGADLYREIATGLELDLPTFNACLENDDYMDWVESDLDFALKTGVRPPTFFINGLALVGAQPIEVFAEVIDAELKTFNNPEQRLQGLEQYDQGTNWHSVRTAKLFARFTDFLGIRGERAKYIYASAALHDIDQLAVPQHILPKKAD